MENAKIDERNLKKVFKKLNLKEDAKDLIELKRGAGPEILDLAITGRCNLNCKHCYWGELKQGFKDIKFNILKRVLKDSLKLGIYHVVLTGGEPLLYKKFKKLLNFLENQRFRISIVTNGTLIEEYVKTFRKVGIYEVTVSLDGFEREYEKIRGIEWEKIVENIKLLKENKIPTRINCVISKSLTKHWKEFYSFCTKELKVDKVTFLPIALKGNAKRHKEILPSLKYVREIIRKIGFTDKPFCFPFYRRIAIGFDGFVYPCQFFRETDEYRLGNIFHESLLKIYRRIKRGNAVQKYKTINCENCEFFKSCGGGCRGRAMAYFNNFEERDPFWCEIFKKGATKKEMLPSLRNPLYTIFAEEYSLYYPKPQKIYDFIENVLKEIQPLTILEIGCGDGSLIERIALNFPKSKITGIDSSKELLAIAKEKIKKYKGIALLNNEAIEFIKAYEKIYDVTLALYSFFSHFKRKEEIETFLNELANISKRFIFDVFDSKTIQKKETRIEYLLGKTKVENFVFNDGKYVYDFRKYISGKKIYFHSLSFPIISLTGWKNLVKKSGWKIEKIEKVDKRKIFIVRSSHF